MRFQQTNAALTQEGTRMSESTKPATGDDAAGTAATNDALDRAEWAIDSSFSTGRADRASITRAARASAKEAVRMVDLAMEADELADDARRLTHIAEKSGNRDSIRAARRRERAARKKANSEHDAATRSARSALNAIKFSAPNRLGMMRVVQVIFALHIASVLIALLLTSRDTIVYNYVTVVDWVSVILEAVAFWFFVNRYRVARPLVLAIAAFNLVVPMAAGAIAGNLALPGSIANTVYNVALILYFATSARVKATLVNDFSLERNAYRPEEVRIARRGWPFVRNLIIYFIVFSLLGHWMEAGMCQFIRLGLVQGKYDPSNTMLWRDWLYPYPMEGAAVVVIALLLYPLWRWLLAHLKSRVAAYALSFVANALTCTVIEFSMGLVVNANLQLWDYRSNFGNIMGQVCLQNTIAFGVAASLIAWFVYPLLERWLARVPEDIMNIAFVAIAVVGGILWSLYLVEPPQTTEVQQVIGATSAQGGESLGRMRADIEAEQIVNETLSSRIEAIDDSALSPEDKAKAKEHVRQVDEHLRSLEKIVDSAS